MDNHNHQRYEGSSRREAVTMDRTASREPWSAEERARIVAESFEPGAQVSAVALRHGIGRGLLYAWRKKAKAAQPAGAEPRQSVGAPPVFVPVTMPEPSSGEKPERLAIGGMIEIEIDGALIKVPAHADKATLRFVLSELRRAP